MFPPIALVSPRWQDPIVNDILALEELRYPVASPAPGHPILFSQLRSLFQTLESIASARIEGNRTTLADYLDAQRDAADPSDAFREIYNIEDAIAFIESEPNRVMDGAFVREIHRRVVGGLQREGDATPGRYSNHGVRITGSALRPPEGHIRIEEEMRHLFAFVSAETEPRDELLRIALFHHRFMAIHPFGNGIGRTGRLATYALLLSRGYRADIGQTLNPTAVFCLDRQRYYNMLSGADTFTEAGLLTWCTYLIGAIRAEVTQINRLTDIAYVNRELLLPALQKARALGRITEEDRRLLAYAVQELRIRNSDLQTRLGIEASQASRMLTSLRERRLLERDPGNSRLYYLNLVNSPLTYPLVSALAEQGFAIPEA